MESCKIKSFAESAFYSVPNRGSGPSIRFAEEVARVYGNFQYGHRELSRADGKSEVEVYAWDMQQNNRSIRQITVMHILDTTSNGPRKLTNQADIDNKIANVASKQIRGRILALMPKWIIAEAIEQCKKTLVGANDEPVTARVRKMSEAFAKYGVTVQHLEKFLGHPLSETTLDEIVDLTGVFNAIKDGAKPSDYFDNKESETEASATQANKLAETAAAGVQRKQQAAAAATPAAPAPEPAPAPTTPPPSAPPAAPQKSNTVKDEATLVKDNANKAVDSPAPQQTPPIASAATDASADDLF
jgi:hypothetical protein